MKCNELCLFFTTSHKHSEFPVKTPTRFFIKLDKLMKKPNKQDKPPEVGPALPDMDTGRGYGERTQGEDTGRGHGEGTQGGDTGRGHREGT